MSIKFLQLNSHRSRPALDLAAATALQTDVSILLVSKPNTLAVRGKTNYIFDEKMDTAIKIVDRRLVVEKTGYGKNFTHVTTPDFTVYSCYVSPNSSLQDLEDLLQNVSNHIKKDDKSIIITGDFNAKSSQWGMNYTDMRWEWPNNSNNNSRLWRKTDVCKIKPVVHN